MPTALFLSPHLDDVAFSCGGLAAILSDRGWTTVLATAFTRSVHPAAGFALACQLDKGLPPEVDYMALRRDEDRRAADILGFDAVRWLDLPEAPHRGYESASALFGALLQGDGIGVPLGTAFVGLAAEFGPALVMMPQGLGNHVDHQQVTAAAQRSFPLDRTAFYRDTPYAIRAPDARPLPGVEGDGEVFGIGAALDRKVAAAQAYGSQIGFQFGGAEGVERALRGFAVREGGGVAAERLSGPGMAELAKRAGLEAAERSL